MSLCIRVLFLLVASVELVEVTVQLQGKLFDFVPFFFSHFIILRFLIL